MGDMAKGGIRLEVTTDMEYLDSVARKPEIYEMISGDHSSERERFSVGDLVAGHQAIFLRVWLKGLAAGFFAFVWLPGDCLEVHTLLSDNCRGKKAVEVGRKAIKWVFAHTSARALMGDCPDWNPAVAVFARRCGLRRFLRDGNYAFKNGRWQGAWLVKINREEVCH